MLITWFSSLSQSGALLTMKSASNPTEGDRDIRSHAEAEFMDFVLKTYRELYKLESRQICGKSSISVFCRFDIGLIQNEHNVQYFVNEVEWTQTASLWTNPLKISATSRSRIGLFGSTFANTFYKWLWETSNPGFL